MDINTNTNTHILRHTKNNGRINIQQPNLNNLFKLYEKIPANQCATFRNPTLGQWDNTNLSLAYFSKENIALLQNGIRAGVYQKSNKQYVIDEQDCDSLKIIMRSYFLQYAVNNPDNITEQIQSLNKMVIDYCVHHVYGEAQGHLKYLNDVSSMYDPIARPIMASQNDKRNYLMPKWF